jgi:hypothetical protein
MALAALDDVFMGIPIHTHKCAHAHYGRSNLVVENTDF